MQQYWVDMLISTLIKLWSIIWHRSTCLCNPVDPEALRKISPDADVDVCEMPWLSPALPVDRMFLVMVTLSSELRAQSTMPLQPFMGKLMSDAAAGRLWMLKTGAGKGQQEYLWLIMLLENFFRIIWALVNYVHLELHQYNSSCLISLMLTNHAMLTTNLHRIRTIVFLSRHAFNIYSSFGLC